MKTLVLVDLQNDFCPGGALPVPHGDEAVSEANRLVGQFELVAATQDWHPPEHGSFAANHPGRQPGEIVRLAGLNQLLWPVHCVIGTPGAEFHPLLDRSRIARVFQKGIDPQVDSYSGFFDNDHRRATGLDAFLRQAGATELYVCGLATEYCVKFTALDAVELGWPTYFVRSASRGVELIPGDIDRAIAEMREAGVQVVDL